MNQYILEGCDSTSPDRPCTGVPEIRSNIFFGGGGSFQPIHIDELRCQGNETTLLSCMHGGVGVHDCGHPEDVGVICQRSQGMIRTCEIKIIIVRLVLMIDMPEYPQLLVIRPTIIIACTTNTIHCDLYWHG